MKAIDQTLGLNDLPLWVTQVELTEPLAPFVPPMPPVLPPPSGGSTAYRRVRVLVRLNHVPVGYALLLATPLSPEEFAVELWHQLHNEVNRQLGAMGCDALTELAVSGITLGERAEPARDLPFISVVVCTRDRPDGAVAALRGLLDLEYPDYEVLLVDNAPSSDLTAVAVAEQFGDNARVRYVLEPRPGLSCARNRGLAEAAGEYIAFTDDDVEVDRWWLQGIAKGFGRTSDVGCVTGLVPSAQLETASQLYFDQRLTWGTSCEPRMFDLVDNRDDSFLYPYSAGLFGTGANFALSRKAALDIEGFDEALGAGTPSGGGEDLDVFVRTILRGHTLVFEPAAIISHVHRSELAELDRQMFNYGCGLTAYLAKYFVNPTTAKDILFRIPKGVMRIGKAVNKANAAHLLPRSIVVREFQGMLVGPWRYWQGKRRLR